MEGLQPVACACADCTAAAAMRRHTMWHMARLDSRCRQPGYSTQIRMRRCQVRQLHRQKSSRLLAFRAPGEPQADEVRERWPWL